MPRRAGPRVRGLEDLGTDLAGTYHSTARQPDTPAEDPLLAADLERLREQGYLILEGLLTAEQLARARDALRTMLDAPRGRNNFEGERTQRLYSVVAHTRDCDPLIEHPRILALLDRLLMPNYLLSQFQGIHILPGETPQPPHYDDAFYPLQRPRPALSAATIWALDDFTAENGATMIHPGSHLWGDRTPEAGDTAVPAVMPAGSVIFFLGTLWHGGGANRTGAGRLGASAQYCEPWLRTQENLFLSTPASALAGRSEDMLRMLGYSIHPPFVGMVNGMHPKRLLETGAMTDREPAPQDPGQPGQPRQPGKTEE